ncbi:hypothetical protein E2C01_033267 [Portunus trituberculatus]|uniref:Uncharacterized protein n=1 Tax=Portunus trituberculatus TaxID=210409 RepID=A0A5B7EXF1_PORTR|nr:hypothetical protein [Portunus trituberculatus]
MAYFIQPAPPPPRPSTSILFTSRDWDTSTSEDKYRTGNNPLDSAITRLPRLPTFERNSTTAHHPAAAITTHHCPRRFPPPG